jgi:hypothetical protein
MNTFVLHTFREISCLNEELLAGNLHHGAAISRVKANKVNLSHYKREQALRNPGGCGYQNFQTVGT